MSVSGANVSVLNASALSGHVSESDDLNDFPQLQLPVSYSTLFKDFFYFQKCCLVYFKCLFYFPGLS